MPGEQVEPTGHCTARRRAVHAADAVGDEPVGDAGVDAADVGSHPGRYTDWAAPRQRMTPKSFASKHGRRRQKRASAKTKKNKPARSRRTQPVLRPDEP